jgi:hypothetical protein
MELVMFAAVRHSRVSRNKLIRWIAGLLPALLLNTANTPAEEIPATAQPMAGWTVPGTQAFSEGNRLFLKFSQSPTSDLVLRLPRLVSVVRSVRWLEGSPTELSVQPEPKEWLIRLSGIPASSSPVLVLTLDEPPRLFQPPVILQAQDGALLLRACEAEVQGKNLRYEPQPHKNTVGYWSITEDHAQWHCAVPADGMYEIDILQGCGNGHGGSQVEVSLQNQKLPLTVVETGHFQNFIWKSLGQVMLTKAADSVLTVRCLKKQAGAVMDVRAVRITPAGRNRTMQPELVAPDQLPESLKPTDLR